MWHFILRLRGRMRGLETYLISCKTGLFVMITSFRNWFPINSICDEKAIVAIISESICHLEELGLSKGSKNLPQNKHFCS